MTALYNYKPKWSIHFV